MDRPRGPLPTRLDDVDLLPPEYDAALDEGLHALRLTLSDEARAALAGHARLVLAWTSSINLTAIREPAAVATLHVVDSLTAVPLLRDRNVDDVLDLGSGAGYPGVPIAVALPARQMLLVESIGKKARFLDVARVATDLGERVAVAAERAEALAQDPRHRDRWSAVLARAVGPLDRLIALAMPLLRPGGALVAWKRAPIDDELRAAEAVLARHGAHAPRIEPVTVPGLADHVLVIVERRDTERYGPRGRGRRQR
ncbi:MAG: 16S rRNA (guanine(527)-N(7))-methyltransferase RsmG [Chloroflexota bacterium]